MKSEKLQHLLLKKCNRNNTIKFIKNEDNINTLSYAEIMTKATDFLYILQTKGVKKGDKVILQIEDNEQFIIAFWACVLGGCIVVPLTAATTMEGMDMLYKIWLELDQAHLISCRKVNKVFSDYLNHKDKNKYQYYLENLTISDNMFSGQQGTLAEVDLEDTLMIQFSSGSTGMPKGAVITYNNLICNIEGIIQKCEITTKDSICSWLPLSHNLGLIVMHLLATYLGIPQIIMDKNIFALKPLFYLQILSDSKATLTASPNFGFKHIVSKLDATDEYNWDFTNLRMIWNGAEPVDAYVCEAFNKNLQKYGLKKEVITSGYGMTEATVVISVADSTKQFTTIHVERASMVIGNKVIERENASDTTMTYSDVGTPIHTCSLRITDEEDRILNENIIGRIQIEGPIVMKEYYSNIQQTEEIMTTDGWLNTGDLGYLRAGKLVVTGREKDVILVNGKNYYPHDIERICEECEEIQGGSVAAVGASLNKSAEEEIVIFIENKSLSSADMIGRIKQLLKRRGLFNVETILSIEQLPKTVSGKIKRNELRQMVETGAFDSQLGTKKNVDSYIASIKKIFNQVLDIKHVAEDAEFFDLGISSLELTAVTEQINKEFSIDISAVDMFSYPNINLLAEYILTEEVT